MMRCSRSRLVLVMVLAAIGLLAGCSDNMYDQQRYEMYEASAMLPQGTTAQHAPEGTVPRRGPAVEPTAGEVEVTLPLLQRGQERYGIYCAPCHGPAGYGNGMVPQRGFPSPPSFHQPRLRQVPDAHIMHVIAHGLGKMPSYAHEVPPADRVAVVAYIRALQLSQRAAIDELPEDVQQAVRREVDDD